MIRHQHLLAESFLHSLGFEYFNGSYDRENRAQLHIPSADGQGSTEMTEKQAEKDTRPANEKGFSHYEIRYVGHEKATENNGYYVLAVDKAGKPMCPWRRCTVQVMEIDGDYKVDYKVDIYTPERIYTASASPKLTNVSEGGTSQQRKLTFDSQRYEQCEKYGKHCYCQIVHVPALEEGRDNIPHQVCCKCGDQWKV